MGEGSSNPSESLVTGTTQRSGEIQDIETPFAGEAVGQIEALVESFRTGKIKKSQSILKIGQIIAGESTGDEHIKSDSLDRYLATLDGIEALSIKSNERGQRFADPVLEKRTEGSGEGGQRHEAVVGDNAEPSQPIDVNDFLEGIPKGDGPQMGGDDPRDGSDSDSSHESYDEPGPANQGLGRSNKKQRIFESQMPWFDAEQQARKSIKN